MAIKIKKEPKEFYKEFRQYEHCFFCNEPTDTWNFETNKPVCKKCSEEHNISELKNT